MGGGEKAPPATDGSVSRGVNVRLSRKCLECARGVIPLEGRAPERSFIGVRRAEGAFANSAIAVSRSTMRMGRAGHGEIRESADAPMAFLDAAIQMGVAVVVVWGGGGPKFRRRAGRRPSEE